jgi:hypothetical protein
MTTLVSGETILSENTTAEAAQDHQEVEQEVEHVEMSKRGSAYIIKIKYVKRLEIWINSLKIRYWIDLGNQEQYNVEWTRKLNSEGDLVEIVIKLRQCKEEGKSSDLLFAITAYLTQTKIMVQGKHRELWKETEFTKLPELVYQLCKTDEI